MINWSHKWTECSLGIDTTFLLNIRLLSNPEKKCCGSASGDACSSQCLAQLVSVSTVHEIRCKLSLETFTLGPQLHMGQSKPTPTLMPTRMLWTLKQLSKPKVQMRSPSPTFWPTAVLNRDGLSHSPIRKKFQKELASALKSALSSHLETVILGLLKTLAQYDASELKAFMKGLRTDEDSLIKIICSCTN